MQSTKTTKDSLLRWCNNRIRTDRPITAETNLLDEGHLDSLFVMDLIVHIERQFGVVVDSREISPRNFRSVRTLTALITANGATR